MKYGYLRVSTEEQALHGHSLAAQEDAIRSACGSGPVDRGIRFFSDQASGKSVNRPGLRSLFRSLLENPADCVWVWKIDRLSRNQPDLWSLIRKIDRTCPLICVTPSCRSDNPAGRLMIGIFAAIAEFELSTLSDRTSSGIARAKKSGIHCGRPGYGMTLKDGVLVLDKKETATLKFILREFALGSSYRTIADRLNIRGVPTKRGGKQWYPSTVKSILTSNKSLLNLAEVKGLPSLLKD